tara:strand:- start:710 stop:1972 length:1263 start_codon:yes stop_codon:yes gene_type:complete
MRINIINDPEFLYFNSKNNAIHSDLRCKLLFNDVRLHYSIIDPLVEVIREEEGITLYPIELYDISLFDNFEIKSNFFTNNILARIKDINSSFYLFFFFPYEGFSLTEHNAKLLKIYNHFKDKYNIPKGKILFLGGNLKLKQEAKKLNLPERYFLGIDIFQTATQKYYHIHNETFDKTELKQKLSKPKDKQFLFRNGKARPHRVFLASYLKLKGILEKTHFSWLDFDDMSSLYSEEVLYKNLMLSFTNRNLDFDKLFNSYQKILNNSPYILDVKPEQSSPTNAQSKFNLDFTFSSYFSLVTESLFNENLEDVQFITEKVYQCFSFYHPFLLAACPGTYEYLHKNGFETYPEIFDESFDSIEDSKLRMDKILDNIENFINKDYSDILSSDFMVDKHLHNKKLFLQRGYDNSLLKELTEFFTF